MAAGLLLKRALDFAAEQHKDQLRKYPNASVPYVSHVAGVVAVLARHGFDEEIQAAGALHDVMSSSVASASASPRSFATARRRTSRCRGRSGRPRTSRSFQTSRSTRRP
jgi:(p)ppGpp synthase/HD superfamily hydrolase